MGWVLGDLGVKLTGGNGFQMNKYGGKMHPIFSRKKKISSPGEKWFMNDKGRKVGLN